MKVEEKTVVKKSSKAGSGLFSTVAIPRGSKIGTMKGFFTNKEHPHCLWLSETKALRVQNKYKYSNHSWRNPNAEMRGLTLYAKKNIPKDSEILWDYSCGYTFENSFDPEKPLYDNLGLGVIHHAVEANNLSLIENCIKMDRKNINLKSKCQFYGKHYFSPIFYALHKNSVKSIKFLINFKDEIEESSTKFNYNILHWTFYYRNNALISPSTSRLLLESFPGLLRKKDAQGVAPYVFWFDIVDKQNIYMILNNLTVDEIIEEFSQLSRTSKRQFIEICFNEKLKIKMKDKSLALQKILESKNFLLTLLL